MRVDIVRELIDRLLAAAQREGSFDASVALEVERAFRHDFRGATCEIHANPRASLPQKQAAVVDSYLKGDSVDSITRDQGISRATLYRYLKK